MPPGAMSLQFPMRYRLRPLLIAVAGGWGEYAEWQAPALPTSSVALAQ